MQKNASESNGLYNIDDFVHDPATDTYTCPQGKVLPRRADTKTGDPGGGFLTYRSAAVCRGCPVRALCTKSRFRKLLVSVHRDAIERSRQRLVDRPGAMRQRAGLAEHPFATLKDRHGYGGLLCRGLDLARAEMGLGAWAYNFTRVINLVGLDRLLEVIRGRASASRGVAAAY